MMMMIMIIIIIIIIIKTYQNKNKLNTLEIRVGKRNKINCYVENRIFVIWTGGL